MSSFQYGSCGRGIPIAGILNPADEHDDTPRVPSHDRNRSIDTARSHDASSHLLPTGDHWVMRGQSPASTSSSSEGSRSRHHSSSPVASSPEPTPCEGPKRKPQTKGSNAQDQDHHRGPPTPPNEGHEPSRHGYHSASYAPQVSCPQPHPFSKTGRPCPCEPCKSRRSDAHALAADRYRQAMNQLLSQMGTTQIVPATAKQLSAFFAELSASDEHEMISSGSVSAGASATNLLSKKEAHKHKEKSRRDTQKSFLLTLSALTPSTFQPCTAHRHAKNNVEEPAHMTTLDRAALYMATQRLTLDRLVQEGKVGRHEVESAMVAEIRHGVGIVREMVGNSEGFVSECRAFGVLNVGMEMEDAENGPPSSGEVGERKREGSGAKSGKVTKRKDASKRRRGA